MEKINQEKCNHKWTLAKQDFRNYPVVIAEDICMKCNLRRTYRYGERRQE